MIEENAEGRQQFQAAPLELTDALFAIGAVCEFFRGEDLVSSRGMRHDLELAMGNVEIDPISGANRRKTSTVERFRNNMGDGNPIVLECDAAIGDQNAG